MRDRRVLPWVMAGGGVGAALGWSALAAGVPVTAINVLGAGLLGLLWGASRRAGRPGGRPWDPRVVPVLGTGVLGSFTTVSTALVWAGRLARDVAHGAPRPVDGTGERIVDVLVLAAPSLAGLAVSALLSTAAALLGLRMGAGGVTPEATGGVSPEATGPGVRR